MATNTDDKKISQLGLVTRFAGKELVPIAVPGANRAASLEMLKEYFRDSTLCVFDDIDASVPSSVSDLPHSEEDGALFNIVYLSKRNIFAERKTLNGTSTYTTSFTRADDFMLDGKVRTDRAFLDVSTKNFYVYNGQLINILDTVRINAMTEEEFENLKNPIEGAFYATYEE